MIRATERVADTASRNRTFWLPDLVSEALDESVARSVKQGYPTKRADVVAALILELQQRSQEEIEDVLRAYARATIEDAFAAHVEDGVIPVPQQAKPGPRRRGDHPWADRSAGAVRKPESHDLRQPPPMSMASAGARGS